MLNFYITSVIIFAVIIYAMCVVFGDMVKAKGWSSGKKVECNPLVVLLCLAAIPIIRLFFIVVILYMASHTPEDLEKLKQKVKEESDMDCEDGLYDDEDDFDDEDA